MLSMELPGSSSNIHPPHVTIATRDTISRMREITGHREEGKNLSFPTFDIISSVWCSLRNHIHCPTVADSSETQLIINARYNITRKYFLFKDMCLVTWYFGLTVHFGWILYYFVQLFISPDSSYLIPFEATSFPRLSLL